MADEVIVVDNAFNRANYPDIIGKRYPAAHPPSYAVVMPALTPDARKTSLEEAITLQPKDCQCLPELFKDFVREAVEEKLEKERGDLEWWQVFEKEHPGTKETSDEMIEAARSTIETYEYLLQQVKSVPVCKGQTRFIPLKWGY